MANHWFLLQQMVIVKLLWLFLVFYKNQCWCCGPLSRRRTIGIPLMVPNVIGVAHQENRDPEPLRLAKQSQISTLIRLCLHTFYLLIFNGIHAQDKENKFCPYFQMVYRFAYCVSATHNSINRTGNSILRGQN